MRKKMKVLTVGSCLVFLILSQTNVFAVLPNTWESPSWKDVDKPDRNGDGSWPDSGDKSCWMASAANMLGDAFGLNITDAYGIYNTLLYHFDYEDYGDGSYHYDRRGYQHQALDWYLNKYQLKDLGYSVQYYSYNLDALPDALPWPDDPFNFAKEQLYNHHRQVGIGLESPAHAVTFYGWDTSEVCPYAPYTMITDSDRDKTAAGLDLYITLSSPRNSTQSERWKIDYSPSGSGQIDGKIDYICLLIPEPATLMLLSLGGLALLRRRRCS